MKTKKQAVLLLALLAIVFTTLGFLYVLEVSAQDVSPQASIRLPQRIQYTSKFVCGLGRDVFSNPRESDVLLGFYATVVNIYNPNPVTVTIHKRVVLAYPEGTNPITPTKRFTDTIKSNHAMSVNCKEMVTLLENSGTPVTAEFIEGYLVVDALPTVGTTVILRQLDVDTVHTAGSSTQYLSSIETIHEDGRTVPAGLWPY